MGDGGPRRDAGQFPLSVCWLLLLAMPARGEHILGLTKVHAAAYHGEAADTSIGVNLEMLEDGPDRPTALDGSPVVSGTPADWWYDGGLTATPVFTVAGGVFEDHQNVSIFCGTIDALIIYTMADLDDADEMDDPALDWRGFVGTVFDGTPLLLTRSTVIRAVAVHVEAMDSEVSETSILIKNRMPTFSVYQGTFDHALDVTISASSSEPSAPPYISVTLDGTDPNASRPLGIGQVTVQVRRSTVLKAIAFQDKLVPSDISRTGVLLINASAVEPPALWRSTLAWWSLGDSKYHFGRYSRGQVRWGGACDEQHPSEIYPAHIAERDGLLGAAVLMGPACKGGVWDVDPAGFSECDFHPLLFNGSLGTSGYVGRREKPERKGSRCGTSRQPNLESFAMLHRGVAALRFDSVNRGLVVANAVDALVAEKRVPARAFSLEVQMTVAAGTGAGRQVRALAAAQQDSAGFVADGIPYSKGWSLLYETDTIKQTVMLVFSVSLDANNDVNNHGSMRRVAHSMPISTVANEQWSHVVAVYDLRTLTLYVNGTLAATSAACSDGAAAGEGGCGGIVYPLATDPQARDATPLTLGLYENRQTGMSVAHVGLLAEVRLFGEALPPHVIAAASQRLMLGNPEAQCPEGSFGAYQGHEFTKVHSIVPLYSKYTDTGVLTSENFWQGLEPCQKCPPGSFTQLPRRDECELCAHGTWHDQPGQIQCLACPKRQYERGGVAVSLTTAKPGAASEDMCEEPDECAAWSGLSNNCHPNATCTKVPGSYTCTCNAGYEGGGEICSPKCGDARVVPGEPCDDGNTLDSDGCSSTCTIEEGYTCLAPANDSPSICECTLDGEVCCARAYVKCLLEAKRFTARGYGYADAGLDQDGCVLPLFGNASWHLGQAGDDCEVTCATVPSPNAPRGGAFECLAHSSFEAKLQFVQAVALPGALASVIAAEPSDPPRSAAGAWACERVVTSVANTGIAASLLPETLPMLDEFSISGARSVADGIPNRELVCYVRDGGLPDVAPKNDQEAARWCRTRPTATTGRRLCKCRRKANTCSRDCLALQAACNANVSARAQRIEAAYEEFNPCYDSPHYQGNFYDNHSVVEVNVSFANCSAVGAFLWHGLLPGSNGSDRVDLQLGERHLGECVEAWCLEHVSGYSSNCSDSTLSNCTDKCSWTLSNCSNSTLRERFLRSASCACGACPATCRVCDKCYQEGGRYWYGGQESTHPPGRRHPSNFHGVAAPLIATSVCADGDRECTEIGCKKALAYCNTHGLEACVDKNVCWRQTPHANACPGTYAALLDVNSARRTPSSQVNPDESSCECMGWYHNCLLIVGSPAP